jgi:hypothetical protein
VVQRWLARLSLVAVGFRASVAVIVAGVRGLAVAVAGLLRVRVPRQRPGVPDPKPVMDWRRLRLLALGGPGPGRG